MLDGWATSRVGEGRRRPFVPFALLDFVADEWRRLVLGAAIPSSLPCHTCLGAAHLSHAASSSLCRTLLPLPDSASSLSLDARRKGGSRSSQWAFLLICSFQDGADKPPPCSGLACPPGAPSGEASSRPFHCRLII